MSARTPSWREVAEVLATRMKLHAAEAGSTCPHSEAKADPDNCPFCKDRAAYQLYERKAGPARRQEPSGPAMTLPEMLKAWEANHG